MAEKITNQTFPRDRKPPALFFWDGSREPRRDIGQTIQNLRTELETAIARVDRRHRVDTDVVIAGWQFGMRRPKPLRPIVTVLNYSMSTGAVDLVRRCRYWHYARGPTGGLRFSLDVAPASNISLAEHEDLIERLPDRSPQEAEEILVDGIRRVASRSTVVGHECMSILLPPPHSSHPVRVRYIPMMPAKAGFRIGGSIREISIAFSPWIIGPGIISAPAILSGGRSDIDLGQFRVSIEAPSIDPREHNIHILRGQERPSWPPKPP
jgi:hypothetical protein